MGVRYRDVFKNVGLGNMVTARHTKMLLICKRNKIMSLYSCHQEIGKENCFFYQSRKLNSKHFTTTEEKVMLRQKLRAFDFFLTHRKYTTDLTS